MRVLIVDDEVVSRKKMERIIQGFGECFTAACGKDAVVAFKKAWEDWDPFDLITLDITMPDMEGTEVLFQIREMENSKHIRSSRRVKVLMVTARADREAVATAIQAGCDDYLTKPFQGDMISRKLVALFPESADPQATCESPSI
jgi:two-component system chemotaxis response regulator CheY